MKNDENVIRKGLTRYLKMVITLSIVLFVSAGTFRFANGWAVVFALSIPSLSLGIYLYYKNHTLLQARLQAKESDIRQQYVVSICTIIVGSGLVLAGLSYRFSWTKLPRYLTIVAIPLYILSMAIYVACFVSNPYLSRTVRTYEKQSVVSGGIYGVIRHPMYLATSLLYLSVVLILDSLIALLFFHLLLPILYKRIVLEEEFLSEGLPGYEEYKSKVRYRLIPYIW